MSNKMLGLVVLAGLGLWLLSKRKAVVVSPAVTQTIVGGTVVEVTAGGVTVELPVVVSPQPGYLPQPSSPIPETPGVGGQPNPGVVLGIDVPGYGMWTAVVPLTEVATIAAYLANGYTIVGYT